MIASHPSFQAPVRRGGVPDNGAPAVVRCAIYTRKSTEEGLSQEFNSLDAQRASAEAYVASQRHAGWACVAERYDDGGFTGGNTERPALTRLMADVEAGKVDCVVVHKVDRLSRSLLDFARLMEVFDRRGVSFVSVTQQFNTTQSMGRLTLNILLSFAQFEREIISERTRDKIASARRKGKYQHGKPLLGYDWAEYGGGRTGKRLAVNAAEAAMVRGMFDLYLRHQSLIRVAQAANERGWRTKAWTTSAGREVGGRAFDKALVSRLLRNPLYAGLVPYREERHPGEHEAIVPREVFEEVQARLRLAAARGGSARAEGRDGGGRGSGGDGGSGGAGASGGSLLRGVLRCGSCGCGMTATSTARARTGGGKSVYRYYTCVTAAKRGRGACPAPSLPAGRLEAFVVEQVRAMVREGPAIEAVAARAEAMVEARRAARREERAKLAERAAAAEGREGRALRQRLSALDREIERDRGLDRDEVEGAIESFDGVWAAMTPGERGELVRALVERVEYDAAAGAVTVTMRSAGERSRHESEAG